MYSLRQIADIVDGELIGNEHISITHLHIDTRKLALPDSLFVALVTDKNNGHRYLDNAKKQGCAACLVSQKVNLDIPYIVVLDTTKALQLLAIYHREKYNIPTIAITGSNGKTIVKEWISTVLSDKFSICKNPKSYNSQIGVPLSVWQLNDSHTLAIFEAGISKPDEMQHLEKIIQPEIGVFTHLGDAHAANFNSQEQKLHEKLKLFKDCKTIVSGATNSDVISAIRSLGKEMFTWGSNITCDLHVVSSGSTSFTLTYKSESHQVTLPFQDKASIENTFTTIATALALGEQLSAVIDRLPRLQEVDMRLQEVKGIGGNQLLVDYYNTDFQSIIHALDFLNQQMEKAVSTLILSDILESDLQEEELYDNLNALLVKHNIDNLIGIGERLVANQGSLDIPGMFYKDTAEFLQKHPIHEHRNETILIKGARKFAFEQIAERLKLKTHQTSLEVNLSRLKSNLDHIKSRIQPKTKVMAMVKALAYGSGGYQVAKLLENNGVEYLGVAYTDEATALREAGISLPIMVLNPDFTDLTPYIELNIQPVIYSFESLNKVRGQAIRIHLEIDTGMHRLGFSTSDIEEVVTILQDEASLELISVFSHLAASDDENLKDFTYNQIDVFTEASDRIQAKLRKSFIRHIANTAGIERYPAAQLDMIRLGIGLYGISSFGSSSELLPVGTFKSYISQIRMVGAGEGIGYGLHSKSDVDRQIAVVAVGYADGYSRNFSQGKGYFYINGKKAAVVGNVCMDMTMCDVSNIICKAGDEVIIFGDEPRVEELAENIGTIAYEVLSNVSDRVNRVYFQE